MKRLLRTAAPLLSVMLLASCAQNSVTVRTGDGSKVRLQAETAEIIRVRAVPFLSRFSDGKSLCVVPHKSFKGAVITREGSLVSLSTGVVTATVDRKTGFVSFTDTTGNVILSENGRHFSPIRVDGTKGYTVRQTFLPQDEGFYGLGQHQADEWDWKGRNEELYQYNTKISVPFVVSSKRYGILWDSYSFCRWGDPRPYAQLGEVFTLRDKHGVTLYMHFYRILKYGALLSRSGYPSPEDKASALAGVNPYFYKEYDAAVRNYPLPKAMAIVSLLCEYDYLGKGGDGATTTPPSELLVELVAKILNT